MRRALLACLALVAFPAAAGADTSFQVGLRAPELAVRGGLLVWTQHDGRSVRLREGFGSAAADLPVPPARDFRGIDLGTDKRGRAVLVYARCPRTRCDIYSYRFDRGRERRIDSVSRRRCTEVFPRIDRGVLAFVRGKSMVRGRCKAGLFVKRPGHRERRVMRNSSSPLWDFAGRTVVFVRFRPGPTSDPEESNPITTEIRSLPVGRRHSLLVARAHGNMNRGGSMGTFLSAPLLDGGYVYWLRSVYDASGFEPRDDIRRRSIGGGATQTMDRTGRLYTGKNGDTLDSFALQGERLFYGYSSAPTFSIGRVEPTPAFG